MGDFSVPDAPLTHSDEQEHRRLIARKANSIAYEEGVFTPTFDFATTGDLSNAYTTQDGVFWRTNSFVYFLLTLNVTPTYTTATGNAEIGGIPYAAKVGNPTCIFSAVLSSTGLTYPGGRTAPYAYLLAGESVVKLATQGSAIAASSLAAADFTTATSTGDMFIQGFYQL